MGQACNCDCDDGQYELYQEQVSYFQSKCLSMLIALLVQLSKR
jgi:hypothetical protein